MEKTAEDIRNELQVFKKLKAEEQAKELKGLEARLKAIDDEIASNRKGIQGAEKSQKDLEEEIALAQRKYSEVRSKRQNLFALNQNTSELDAEIWKLHLDLEAREALRADALAGVKRRNSDLTEEIILLEQEKEETKRMILRYADVPRVGKFNQLISQAFKVFEEIFENQLALNHSFEGAGNSRYRQITVSSWEPFDQVPKIYLDGDVTEDDQFQFGRLKWTWDRREFLERWRKKREEKNPE
jgi:chromosome segregation ATPase